MKVYYCPNCGAPVSEYASKCSYCGSPMANSNRVPEIKNYSRRTETIRAKVAVPKWALNNDAEAITQFALNEIRNQMSDALLGLMTIQTKDDSSENTKEINASIDVVIPRYDLIL